MNGRKFDQIGWQENEKLLCSITLYNSSFININWQFQFRKKNFLWLVLSVLSFLKEEKEKENKKAESLILRFTRNKQKQQIELVFAGSFDKGLFTSNGENKKDIKKGSLRLGCAKNNRKLNLFKILPF